MCVVSAVSDYYFKMPEPERYQFDDDTKKMLREVVRRLDEIDKKLGDVECHDEKKAEFMKIIGYTE